MSKLFIAAAFAAVTLAGPALAGEPVDQRVQSVPTAGVDFQDRAQVEALYARLQTAAQAVCDNYGANGRVTAADRACASKALAGAVKKADRPTLTALYKNSHGERQYAAR